MVCHSPTASLVLTDVDLDGQTLFVIPHAWAVTELETWSVLKRAKTFGRARRHQGAALTVELHLAAYVNAAAQEGRKVFTKDRSPFDADAFFGEENWASWTPNAREATAGFLTRNAPSLAQLYLRPDPDWGLDYTPLPFVHLDDRELLESALRSEGYEVRQWPGLAAMFLSPPADVARALRLR